MSTPGGVIAGYRIVRVLGSGGNGTVYAVEDPQLPRLDALKVLAAHRSGNAEVRGRFLREAEIAANLDHPNIVAIYDRGETPQGELWIAMQLVDGVDAHTALSDGPLPPERTVHIIASVASALDFAHSRGVVHGDVKPANILLAHVPGHGERALLTDFGIARALDETPPAVGGHRGATVAYGAPEVLSGHPGDRRSDIYSLGCTLFELLTGQLPYADADGLAAQVGAHLTRPAPAPSAINPGVPQGLDGVLAVAMAKNPADRYPSAAEFAAAARRALHSPTAAQQTSAARTRRRWLAVGGVVLTMAAAGALFAAKDRFTGTDSTAGAAPTTAVASYPSDRLADLMVRPDDIRAVMNNPLESGGPPVTDFLDNDAAFDGSSCVETVLPLQLTAYRGTGAVSSHGEAITSGDEARATSVIQAVVAYPTAELATQFVSRQTAAWTACAFQTVTVRNPPPPRVYQTGAAEEKDGTLTAINDRVGAPGQCQRALTTASNIVIDVRACTATQVTDQAVTIARRIAAKVDPN